LAWKGLVSNDSFHAVRKGALHAFSPHGPGREDPAGYRSAFHRWESTRPMAGNWFIVPAPAADRDPVDEEELRRDRVRQLLRRYGLLFRELLAQELPPLRWQPLFKTLRLMELSGEIVSGHFFEGIAGLQFLSPAAFRVLNRPLPEDAVYWMSAADPASLCGVRLDGLEGLPARRDTTLTVFKGKDLVMVAAMSGASLVFRAPPEDPRLPEYLSCFGGLMDREFSPRFDIRVDRINGEAAAVSAYARALMEYGFVRDYRALTLRKQYPERPVQPVN
jgi:ATP-dependent Lhr-like helicase